MREKRIESASEHVKIDPIRVTSIRPGARISNDGKTALFSFTVRGADDVNLVCRTQVLDSIIAELQRVADTLRDRSDNHALETETADPTDAFDVHMLANRPYLRLRARRKSGRVNTILIPSEHVGCLISEIKTAHSPPASRSAQPNGGTGEESGSAFLAGTQGEMKRG